jgi:AraC-like DNA-binding protein
MLRTLVVEEAPAVVRLVFRGLEGPVSPQAQEYTLAIVASRIRHVDAGVPDLSVSFTFPRPAHAAEHRRVLGLEPMYSARDAAVAIGRTTWERPTRTADAGLFGTLDAHARAIRARGPSNVRVQERVRAAVAAALPGREPTVAAVARALGTSSRTLQRWLAEDGEHFASIVDAVRRERAEAFLRAPDVSMAEVSWLLGFAEQSAFTRAFRRWTGTTPTEWRRGRREAGS